MLLCLVNPDSPFAQGVLEFTDCKVGPYRLCAQSPGVRLPDNNQLYLGENHPEASRGSVHVTQSKTVHSDCSGSLSYVVELLQFNLAPSITIKPTTLVNTDSEGMALLSFDTEEAMDEIIMQNGIPYTTGCDRFHKVRWIVRDTCGNETICEELIEVFDCVEPMVESDPEEVFTITIPIGLQYTVVAKNFVDSILDDQSLKGDFLYSLRKDKYLPKATYDCCEVPAYGVVVPYSVWIAEKGIDQNCDGVIEWSERGVHEKVFNVVYQDNSGSCDCFESTLIAGTVYDQFGEGIENVIIKLKSDNAVFHNYVTSSNGSFNYLFTWENYDVAITPEKYDNHRNGVSILDVIKLQKYLLGEDTLNTFELIAADADNSEHISFFDVFELKKLVLGLYTELPFNTSWRFVPKDYIFSDPKNPWVFPEEIEVTTDVSQLNNDFIGIKIGDLNGTAQPNLTSLIVREAPKQLHFQVESQYFGHGEIIDVPVRSNSDVYLLGAQFTLETDGMEILDILPGVLNISEQDFALFGDKMTLAWMDMNGIETASDETLFTLRLRAKSDGTLSRSMRITSAITPAEIYTLDEQTFEPTLSFDTPEVDRFQAEVTCAPNPWADHTTISLTLKESSDVHLDIYTINGLLVKTMSERFPPGSASIMIRQSDLENEGVYLYRLTTSEFDITQKMILNK